MIHFYRHLYFSEDVNDKHFYSLRKDGSFYKSRNSQTYVSVSPTNRIMFTINKARYFQKHNIPVDTKIPHDLVFDSESGKMVTRAEWLKNKCPNKTINVTLYDEVRKYYLMYADVLCGKMSVDILLVDILKEEENVCKSAKHTTGVNLDDARVAFSEAYCRLIQRLKGGVVCNPLVALIAMTNGFCRKMREFSATKKWRYYDISNISEELY